MKPEIIFEDEALLVLAKPAGMVVNRAASVKRETVQDWLEKKLKIKDRGIGGRAGIVHRLDKETSGLLLVAKTPEAFANLQAQFKERKVEKRYFALVHGKVEEEKGEIEAPVGRLAWNRKRFGVFPGGRRAKTKYKVKNYYALDLPRRQAGVDRYTLLELVPETGRTHQIRVHLKYLGHSVVADSFYAGRKTAREDRKWCPRLFLHAWQISFSHPKTGKRVSFSSKLPGDLKIALRILKEDKP